MTEATFEARLDQFINAYLPTIKHIRITHQETFTLKLGHHTIEINGKERENVGGRLDTLLSVDKTPLVLLELKKPGKPITGSDKDQGISYARLLDQMPPLVIISNGSETQIYNTYDRSPFYAETLTDEIITSIFETALSIASKDKKEAIEILVGSKREIWSQILSNMTHEAIENLTGDIADLTKPICADFFIPRDITQKIINHINANNHCIVLDGAPLSGKTNICYDFILRSSKEGIIPLYLDAEEVSYGLFKHLANYFSGELNISLSEQDIRNWLILSFKDIQEKKIAIIIDSILIESREVLLQEIKELLQIIDKSNIYMIVTVNDSFTNDLLYKPGRSTLSSFGRKASHVTVPPLSRHEFSRTLDFIFHKYSWSFLKGVRNNITFRSPRLLRILTSIFKKNRPKIEQEERAVTGVIPGIPSPSVLSLIWNNYITDPLLKFSLNELAESFIADYENRNKDKTLTFLALNSGCISLDTVKKVLEKESFDRLLSLGYLKISSGTGSLIFCEPKMPEVIAYATIFILSEQAIEILDTSGIKNACDHIMKHTKYLPYGDIVGALCIYEIARKKRAEIPYIISYFLENRPIVEKVKNNLDARSFSKRFGDVQFKLEAEGHKRKAKLTIEDNDIEVLWDEDDEDSLGYLYSENQNWLILSHLAGLIEVETETLFPNLFTQIGSFEYSLLNPESIYIEEIEGYHTHNIGNEGEIVCSQSGIIEPITLSMWKYFSSFPNKMKMITEYAVAIQNPFLINRLMAAFMYLQDSTNEEVASSSKSAMQILKPNFMHIVQVYLQKKDSKPPKTGRNKKCPCGSGKKYKKCCGK